MRTSILTLVLPPACAFLLAAAELFSFARLATSYHKMRAAALTDELRRWIMLTDRLEFHGRGGLGIGEAVAHPVGLP